MKKEVKKLTFTDLISKKIEKEQNQAKFKEIEVPSLRGVLLFEKPNSDDILDTLDKITTDESIRNVVEAYKFIIYQCCPTLKSPELQAEYEVSIPTDIVTKVLELQDILTIGNELLEFAGMKSFAEQAKK